MYDCLYRNKVIGWQDFGGSLQRRIIIIKFTEPVSTKDIKMPARIKNRELGAILFRACLSKKIAFEMFGSVDLLGKSPLTYQHPDCINQNKVLPKTMINWNAMLQQELDPLYLFISEGIETDEKEPLFLDTRDIPVEEKVAVPLYVLHNNYKKFASGRFSKGKVVDLTEDTYGAVFKTFKLQVKKEHREWNNVFKNCPFVIGIGSSLSHPDVYAEIQKLRHEQATKNQQSSVEQNVVQDTQPCAEDDTATRAGKYMKQAEQDLTTLCKEGQTDKAWNYVQHMFQTMSLKSMMPKKTLNQIATHNAYAKKIFGIKESNSTVFQEDNSDSDTDSSDHEIETERLQESNTSNKRFRPNDDTTHTFQTMRFANSQTQGSTLQLHHLTKGSKSTEPIELSQSQSSVTEPIQPRKRKRKHSSKPKQGYSRIVNSQASCTDDDSEYNESPENSQDRNFIDNDNIW